MSTELVGNVIEAPTVVVVGGGFSGALTAAHLLRREHPGGLRLVLVDRGRPNGRGVAYSTPCVEHRLNVPASNMSAFPGDPGHFLRWARERDPSLSAESFLPRGLYGDYVESILDEAEASAGPQVSFERLVEEVVGIVPAAAGTGSRLFLASGGELRADRVVIATGNMPAAEPRFADPQLLASERWCGDAWDPALLSRRFDGTTLLLGSGLTMVDLALVLGAAPDAPPLLVVSRTGVLPRAHLPAAVPADPRPHGVGEEDTIRGVLARLLVDAAVASDAGGDWREAVDALRPATNRIWAVLSLEERRWFVDNLARIWEVHRHRMAPQVAARIETMRRRGGLRVVGASVERMELDGDAVAVTLTERACGRTETLRVGRVVNCTGPGSDLAAGADPLVRSLIAGGLARVDPLGLGLEVSEEGALVSADGELSAELFVIGPLRKGALWETTAVPELRVQADQVARLIARPRELVDGTRRLPR